MVARHEVKALREKANIREAYAQVRKGELWLEEELPIFPVWHRKT